MRTGIQFIDRTLRYCISTSRLFLVFAFGRDVEKSDFTLNSEKIANNIISDLAVLLHSPMLKTKTKSIFACFLLSCLFVKSRLGCCIDCGFLYYFLLQICNFLNTTCYHFYYILLKRLTAISSYTLFFLVCFCEVDLLDLGRQIFGERD